MGLVRRQSCWPEVLISVPSAHSGLTTVCNARSRTYGMFFWSHQVSADISMWTQPSTHIPKTKNNTFFFKEHMYQWYFYVHVFFHNTHTVHYVLLFFHYETSDYQLYPHFERTSSLKLSIISNTSPFYFMWKWWNSRDINFKNICGCIFWVCVLDYCVCMSLTHLIMCVVANVREQQNCREQKTTFLVPSANKNTSFSC